MVFPASNSSTNAENSLIKQATTTAPDEPLPMIIKSEFYDASLAYLMSKLVESTILFLMVIVRLRGSMYKIASAASSGLINAPSSFALRNLSYGQSASNAESKGAGKTCLLEYHGT